MSKVCILSGAASGIGLSLAKILLEKDYKVYGLSLTKKNWDTARSFVNNHTKFNLHTVNISKPNEPSLHCKKR